MSQPLVYILLFSALALPLLGAVALRLLVPRLTARQLYGAAGLIFGVAVVSIALLVGSDVPSLQIGRLSILLPVSAPDDRALAAVLPVPTEPMAATAAAAPAAAAGTAAATPTSIPPTAPPTTVPTATAAPTEPPTAIPAPTEPPTAPPAAPRKHTVQPGETLGAIAKKYDVTVQALSNANKLTLEQADALRIGQELVIP